MRLRDRIKLPTMGLLFAAVLAGCSGTIRADRPRVGEVAATCADQAQCERYWTRAQDWVTLNSKRPVRNVTDWMIITTSPGVFDSSLTFEIKRWAGPKDSGEIRFDASCSDFLPCSPSVAQARQSFSSFVTAP
jgi:hypothetical protein